MARFARIGAAVAAAALTVGLAAPAAQAQTVSDILGFVKVVNDGVEKADCNTLGTALRGLKLVDKDTTRGELVSDLQAKVSDTPSLKFVAASTINKIGDRAVECKIVKADPVTPLDVAINTSSQLSSKAGLPELRDLLPMVTR